MTAWNGLRALAAVALTGFSLAACETNPATGKQSLTGLVSPEQEIALTKEEHPKIIAQYGEYQNPQLQRYIEDLGEKLAAHSERTDLPWKFTILDTPDVNAFALPGGYIYVNRGLLALASNEAEVASVLSHEIGHVNARHAAQRQGQATLAGIGAALAGILTGSSAVAQLANTVGTGYVQSYSREQEFEADSLGVRYMSRAGYDPNASVSFLRKLLAESQLQATIQGHPEAADRISWTASHPRTADRVEQAIKNAGVETVANPIVNRDLYLSKIDGMIYGDDPKQGIVRGRTFVHPGLGFAFDVPSGFTIINMPDQVAARSREGGIIVFARWAKAPSGSLAQALSGDPKMNLQQVQRIDVNGMEGATGMTQGQAGDQAVDVRVVAIRYDAGTVYRFLFASPPSLTDELSRPFRETTYSFRKVSQSEGAKYQPLRIQVVTVGSGDTVQSLARRMAEDEYAEQRFRLLNGLDANGTVQPGMKVKLVR